MRIDVTGTSIHRETTGGRGAVIHGAVVAALGGLLFGFDTAVISGTTDALKLNFRLDSFWLGFTVAVALMMWPGESAQMRIIRNWRSWPPRCVPC
jgi:hypothetical protein